MSLSTLAIRRSIGTLMLTLAAIALGVFFIPRLPVDLLPAITYPRLGVRVDTPGILPEVAIDEITRPLERALVGTEGIEQIYSRTREGRVSIDLYFQAGEDIDRALGDATTALNRARRNLPGNVGFPRLFKFDPSQSSIYDLALTSPSLPGVALRVFAEQELARNLSTVPGIAEVEVSGGVREEVSVEIDLDRLQALGLDLNDVLQELGDRNQDTPGGRLGEDTGNLTRVVGRFENPEEIGNLLLNVPGSEAQVYLRDFATIIDSVEQQRVFVSLNGESAVKVSISKQPQANTVAVVDRIKAELQSMRESGLLPEDLVVSATKDNSRFVRSAIRNVAISGLLGALLAGVAIFFFLGSWRQTLIVTVAIPLATLVAILLMAMGGLSLNVFSLGGLALGAGIVVDNAIVMLENIVKGVRDNDGESQMSLTTSAERSARELESAIIASTATNLVVILPFLLLGGLVALVFGELVLTISFAVAASLVVALTVVPALSTALLAAPGREGRPLGLVAQFQRQLALATLGYAKVLAWVLQRPFWAVAIAFLLLGGSSYWLLPQIPREILPAISTGQARFIAWFPRETTLAQNRSIMAAVDAIVMAQPETEYVFTTAGGFLFGTTTREDAQRGAGSITLKPGTDVPAYTERLQQAFAEQLNLVRGRVDAYPGTVWGLSLSNSPLDSQLDIVFQGEDAELLDETGQRVLSMLNEKARLARYRREGSSSQREIRIYPDWERAAALGLNAKAIGETVQTALAGSVPTRLQRGDRLVPIRVQLPPFAVQTPRELAALPLFTDSGNLVRLGDVARIEEGTASGEIRRLNQRQVFLIGGDLSEGAHLGDALAEIDAILGDVELPVGIVRVPGGAAETNRQLQQSLILLSLLATFLVYVVMAVQYNSLRDPLAILLTVPLALAGGIFGLYLTNTAISATVIIGAVLLVGIAVNNAIIMVERANQIRDEEGLNRTRAILLAAPQRLRPILMTTVTTVLGLFPLALGIGEGSEFLQPLGITVFSGLSVATVLTLVIIPCFYVLLPVSRREREQRSLLESRKLRSPR